MLEPLQAPINKVGLVLLRDVQGDDPLVCLTQVKAKDPAEQHLVDFGLPKGTRQYLDAKENTWKDARDFILAHRHRDALELLSETLMKEAEQEIGVPKNIYAKANILNLGERLFESRKGKTFDIQWYVMEANQPLLDSMNPTPPDAYAVKWVRMSELRAMEEAGEINACYVDVAEEAVDKLRQRQLRPAQFIEPPLATR